MARQQSQSYDPHARTWKRIGWALVVLFVLSIVLQFVNHAMQKSAVRVLLGSRMSLGPTLPRDVDEEHAYVLSDLRQLNLHLDEEDVDVVIDHEARTWESEVRYSRRLHVLFLRFEREFVVRHAVTKHEALD